MTDRIHVVWFMATAELLARDYRRLGFKVRICTDRGGYRIEAEAPIQGNTP